MANEKQPAASAFAVLSKVNCNEHTEQKNNLTYLSWAWAWHICKSHFPEASYTIYENADGRPYFDDGRTAWVKTGVTINGQEHIEYLPIMDYKNVSIPVGRITSMDMNKSIQRSLTKAIARHGLGLYIYAGEDLPDALDDEARDQVNAKVDEDAKKGKKKAVAAAAPAPAATAAPAAAPAPKKPLPERGSEEWSKWVKAIVTGWTSKQGKTATQAFAATYEAAEDVMQDVLGCLEEDAFNLRVEHPELVKQANA